MSGAQRREQLLDIGRALFAAKGFDATSIEEVASRASVSKPVVYEHFGGKEGLYAAVIDREMRALLTRITSALRAGERPRALLEHAALALLDHVEESSEGFHILVRDCLLPPAGDVANRIGEAASSLERLLGTEFEARGHDATLAALYSHALVGMAALTAHWWLETGRPAREQVAAHLVNLAWNGLSHLEPRPALALRSRRLRGRSQDREP